MVNELDYCLEVSEFEFLSQIYVHFQKSLEPLYPHPIMR